MTHYLVTAEWRGSIHKTTMRCFDAQPDAETYAATLVGHGETVVVWEMPDGEAPKKVLTLKHSG